MCLDAQGTVHRKIVKSSLANVQAKGVVLTTLQGNLLMAQNKYNSTPVNTVLQQVAELASHRAADVRHTRATRLGAHQTPTPMITITGTSALSSSDRYCACRRVDTIGAHHRRTLHSAA